MISQPATPGRTIADLAAPRPGTRPAAGASGFGFLALGLLALGLVVLASLIVAPASDRMSSGPAFRPSLTVVAPHTAPAEVPRMDRMDRDVTAVAAADIELPADPAMPGRAAVAVPVPGFVPVPYGETRAALPAPVPPTSLLRPPRAA